MNLIECPAIDGRYALGFLAGLGAANLIEQSGRQVRLSWSEVDATARLHVADLQTLHDVVSVLTEVVNALPDDTVVPGGPPGLPPAGEAPDKLRLAPRELAALVDRLREVGDPSTVELWINSLVTDLALDDKGRCAHTLFGAFSGKQSMYTMFVKSLTLVRQRPSLLHEALAGWRRVDGVTGEYLDHRVLFDAADSPIGESRERGVPGATWLALMSYPLVRTTSVDGRRASTTGWYVAGRRQRLRWPLWRQPLDLRAAVAVWEFPLVTAVARRDDIASAPERMAPADAGIRGAERAAEQLGAMGIFPVHRAERRRIEGRNFAGVLAPVR